MRSINPKFFKTKKFETFGSDRVIIAGNPVPKSKNIMIKQMDSLQTVKDKKEDDYDKIRRLQKKSYFRGLTDSSEIKPNLNSPGKRGKFIWVIKAVDDDFKVEKIEEADFKKKRKNKKNLYKKKYSAIVTMKKDNVSVRSNGSYLKPILKRTRTKVISPQLKDKRLFSPAGSVTKSVTFKPTKTVFLIRKRKKKKKKVNRSYY